MPRESGSIGGCTCDRNDPGMDHDRNRHMNQRQPDRLRHKEVIG
jgi:hypothetical protein